MISVLGKQKAIAGISGLQFICDTTIKSMAEEGLIWEAGYEDNINFELFLKEKPDVALIYGVGTEHARYVARLEKLGIHVIYIAEYLEDHPLGRLEWIRLFGILFNNYQKADSIFLAKSESYHSSCIRISDSSRRPVIFSGSPIGDNWYVPGGNSYMANLINDAGGLYILHQNKTNESYPISFENAYRHILTSDIWINCDIPGTVVYGQNSRYLNTPPVINRKVFSNTARTGNGNGNDFWESGVVNPEIILKDLIYIIQPESIKNHQHVYYQKM
jgi:iron complex transport system substrate-binding protein